MKDEKKVVPFREAIEQVQVAYSRLALMHLAYSRILVKQFGDERGEELVIKGIMEYGRLIEEYSKKVDQTNPFYGIHEKYIYEERKFVDTRDIFNMGEELDFSKLEIHGCSLAKVFQALDEEELGKLYCYIDASRSMAEDLTTKAIHTKCILCGDDFCQIKAEKTTEKEQRDFQESNKNWKNVDSILL